MIFLLIEMLKIQDRYHLLFIDIISDVIFLWNRTIDFEQLCMTTAQMYQ